MIYDVERIMDPGQHPPTPDLAEYFSCAYVLKVGYLLLNSFSTMGIGGGREASTGRAAVAW